jgi:hypothetical protein
VIEFSGPKAAKLFWLMATLNKNGIFLASQASQEREGSKRTKADVCTEADIDDAIDEVSCAYRDAAELGTVPEEILAAVQSNLDVSITEPLWPGGEPQRFLKPAPDGEAVTLRLESLDEYKRLMANIERAIPTSAARHARDVRDLLVILENAPTRPPVSTDPIPAPATVRVE